ncbi:unnamed protein product [Chondrus crispus]|uniref:Uncharacterized protein n=1 Tax=Chondrus crispus TaxID=2769 RepID=S0F397_CHOCR|nr:unnamed protein product [Chondrus crispus]CDF77597.1 unnamed protein product [Chondrus crispus]|eukprot:XP_005718461.1 unnamed protein product [Chondrus crispus]
MALRNNMLSLKTIGDCIYSASVRIEGGKTCFNLLSGGSRRLGVHSSSGVFFRPGSDLETYGRTGIGSSSARWVDAHIEARNVVRGEVINRLTLSADTMYLIGSGVDTELTGVRDSIPQCTISPYAKFVKIDWWRKIAEEAGITLNILEEYGRPEAVILQRDASGNWETGPSCNKSDIDCPECKDCSEGIVRHAGRCGFLSEEEEGRFAVCVVPEHAMFEAKATGGRYMEGRYRKRLIMRAIKLIKVLRCHVADQVRALSNTTGLKMEEVIMTMTRMGEVRREFAAANLCFLLDSTMNGALVQKSPVPVTILQGSTWRHSGSTENPGMISEITGVAPVGTVTDYTFHERRTGDPVPEADGGSDLKAGTDSNAVSGDSVTVPTLNGVKWAA